ncbi:conserved hypothetical protein [Mesorhizobium sp. ORS 3324]|nr:conserved hypothetical protein [Mesorhizobium sp. ORS 3324]
MAVMIESRTLHGKPEGGLAGPSLGILAQEGAKVQVLSEILPRFVEIKVLDMDGQPVGWVTEDAVDKKAGELPPIDGANLAGVVLTHAETFGVNGHFPLAYAHMRSGFSPTALAGGGQGPFDLTPVEWAYYGARPDLGVEFPEEALTEWRSQSLVSAVRLMLVQNMLTSAMPRAPTWAEVALALMCGPDAVAAAIKAPERKVVEAVAADAAGVDVANIAARFSEFVDGQTAAGAVEKIAAKLQVSADATKAFVEALIPDDGSGSSTVGDTADDASAAAGTGKLIDISDTDLDALARVAQSEVAIFARFGDDQLRGGLAGVVDTIFNRVAHVAFPGSIQQVIDQKSQFSAINKLGTWTKLPAAEPRIFDIVREHVEARAGGEASIIKGATHFLNPFASSPSAMRNWGQFVVDHAVAKFGSVAERLVHFHGTAPGTGQPHESILKRGGKSFQFGPDGQPVAPATVTASSGSFSATGTSTAATIQARLVGNALAEWNFFEQGKRVEDDDPQFRRIGTYWQAVGENFDGRTLIPGSKPGELINPAWSAAFISYIVRISGGGDRFLYAQAHSVYVQDFVVGHPGGLYEAMRPEHYAPQPGDLVHAGREGAKRFDFDAARAAFKADKRYASHSDLVIEVNGGFAITIGGNVSQSVTKKRLKLNPDGTLKTRSDSVGVLPWIAVLRCLG